MKLKSKKDIQILQEGGKYLSQILENIKSAVAPGISSLELENIAKDLIKKTGGEPAFLNYAPHGGKRYPSALCVSINEGVVHTPGILDYKINEGDVVSLDLGLKYKGMITDMATTTVAGEADLRVKELINTTRRALKSSIEECLVGAPLSNVGKKIGDTANNAGFSVIKELVGHGVGFSVHEEPIVLNYYDPHFDKLIMEEGLVIAIEPMLAMGNGNIELAEDQWTYRTKDKSISAHFEATVAVTNNGPLILTPIV